MAKSRENGTTILLGLKGHDVKKVAEEERGIIAEVKAIGRRKPDCPRCHSSRLYRHGLGKTRRVLHSWGNGKKVYLELHCQRRQCGCSFSDGTQLLRPYPE